MSDVPSFYDEYEVSDDVHAQSGWRMEKNTNGYYRWRWTIKDAQGNSVKYITDKGKTAYKRGSQYVRIKDATQE